MSEPDLAALEAPSTQPYDERLLLAERTDAEINQAVLEPMTQTGKWFWVVVTSSVRS
jgi:hypothetical protein